VTACDWLLGKGGRWIAGMDPQSGAPPQSLAPLQSIYRSKDQKPIISEKFESVKVSDVGEDITDNGGYAV